MPTRVVHVRLAPFDIYIGRQYAEFEQSYWANPFHIGPDGDRDEVLRKFWNMAIHSPVMLSRIRELRDKTLGCWCKDKPRQKCHGDILALLANYTTL